MYLYICIYISLIILIKRATMMSNKMLWNNLSLTDNIDFMNNCIYWYNEIEGNIFLQDKQICWDPSVILKIPIVKRKNATLGTPCI